MGEFFYSINRVPPLLENLQQGLLDQSVDDARHAEPTSGTTHPRVTGGWDSFFTLSKRKGLPHLDRADWREAWALFPGSVAYIWHAGTKAGIASDSCATVRSPRGAHSSEIGT
jgi:hypothetical protein